jgi:hypothetical protein
VRHAPVQHHLGDSDIKAFEPKINWPAEIAYVFSSPYQRCVQTARTIGIGPINIDAYIAEYLGCKNSKPLLCSQTLEYAPPDTNETWQEFEQRLIRHLSAMSDLEGNILIFTHGIVIKHLAELHFGTPIWKRARQVPFATCSLVLGKQEIEKIIYQLEALA